jgi:diaminopimelate epimerase
MTVTRFHKMHGLGNDFVVIDARETMVDMSIPRAAAIANRRTGIGCDQLIVLERSPIATLKMRIFNADGGEVEACGNATRCVAMLLGEAATIETLAGVLHTEPGDAQATVTLGQPAFDWELIPLAMPIDTSDMPVSWDELDHPAAVNVGNPHVIFFVEDCDAIDLENLGPRIENDPLFPERVNVNVASIIGDQTIKLRVWERGVGLTRACGTGACATAVAGIRSRRVNSPVTVHLPGGDLIIEWVDGGVIKMSGPAAHVFTGETDWDAFG